MYTYTMNSLAIFFTPRNCLLVTAKLARNAGKEKFIDNDQGTAFDGKGCWNLTMTLLKML